MSYSVTVPLITMYLDRQGAEDALKALKKVNADRVFLVAYRSFSHDDFREQNISAIKKYSKYFSENGIEPVIWVAPIFGYGSLQDGGETSDKFMQIKSLRREQIAPHVYCPSDKEFTEKMSEYVGELSELGVKTIMLDDDYCLACRGEIWGCCCENHRKEYCRRIGRDMTREEICQKVLCEGGNEYRDVWIEMQRDTMLDFAKAVREKTNDNVRVGVCAGRTSWDIECADALEIARVLAGKHRPIIRLSSAPYWVESLGSKIEAARLQCHWLENQDVEYIAEGDTYPRPRYSTPASELEGFDIVLRCDGQAAGILKYMLDYNSSARFENGYIEHHLYNLDKYDTAKEHFSKKRAVGVRVFEPQKIFAVQNFDYEQIHHDKYMSRNALPTVAQQFATDNALSVTYKANGGANIVFGDTANFFPESEWGDGVYLDVKSALILKERGLDVGIDSAEVIARPELEYFEDENEYVSVNNEGKFFNVKINKNAVVRSWFIVNGERVPAVFRYENESGNRFTVICVDAERSRLYGKYMAGLFRNYCRTRQVQKDLEWLQKAPLVAKINGQPDLYLMVKEDDDSLAIGVFNFFHDAWLNPVVELGDEYQSAEFYYCSGKLEGKRIILDRMEAHGFGAIVLKKGK